MNIVNDSKIYASTLTDRLIKNTNSESGLFSASGGTLGGVTSAIIDIALPLAGTAALVILIVGGYKMITSQGNPDKLRDAKEMITNAIIGLVFILLSVGILLLISDVFKLDIDAQ